MYYHSPEDRDIKELAPGVRARSFWGENLMLLLVDFDPQAAVPSHQHPHEQAGTVLSGELEFTIGGKQRMLRAGDLYFIPSQVEHSARSLGSAAQVMDVFTPIRQDLK